MDTNPYSLNFWVNEPVTALVPLLNPNPINVTIRGVDVGGVWLECEEITASFCLGPLAPADANDRAKVVAFIPFTQILYIATLDHKGPKRSAQVLNFDKPSEA